MTKRYVVAALALASVLCSVDLSQALDTQLAWEGFVSNVTATASCSGVGGTTPGDISVGIFRPHINVADTPTALSLIKLRAALALTNTSEATIHQMNGAGTYSGDAIDNRAKAFTYASTYHFTVTPFPVLATTEVIFVTGTFNNYFGVVGCDLGIKGVFVQRID
jgi:hypothetical protein